MFLMIPNLLSHHSLSICLYRYKGSDGHLSMACWVPVSGEEFLCQSLPIPFSVHNIVGPLPGENPRRCAICLQCCCSLKKTANVSNAFKYLMPGDGKCDAGNGLLRALVSSMAAFLDRYFCDNDVNYHCCGENSTVSLTRYADILMHIWSNISSILSRPQCTIP